jgi:hypothetical protein
MTDPQIAIQLHWICQAIGEAGADIAGAIIVAALLRAMFNK